jgi:hypothetical protein
MARPWIGIRLSAALAILGSLATLLLAGGLSWFAFHTEAARLTRAMLIVLALFFGGLSIWGTITGAGVFQRRAWARLSMLVFALLLVGMGISALIGILLIRIPQSSGEAVRPVVNIRLIIAVLYAGLTLIGIWWLMLFTSGGARQYFSEPRPKPAGASVSLDIIGWCLLLFAVATATAAILRVPVVVFGAVVANWGAMAIYTVYTAVEIYLGTGLLGRQEPARLGSIGYCGFWLLNCLAWIVLPGGGARSQTVQDFVPAILRLPAAHLGEIAWIGCVLAAAPIWFLVRYRAGSARPSQ